MLGADIPDDGWQPITVAAGSKGPQVYDWAVAGLPYDSAPEFAQWLLIRRASGNATDLAYYRAFGPEGTTCETLARVAGTRWVIEEGFERAKGTVGLDQYEVRKWAAWYRPISLSLLAHAFLEVTRVQAAWDEQKGGSPISSL